jgi:hypothetical protein
MPKVPKRRGAGQRIRRPKTLAQFNAKPKRFQIAWDKTGSVVTRVRKGDSLRAAAADLGIDPRTALRLAGSALRKKANGRYVAAASDTLLRVVTVAVAGGRVEVALPNSHAATAYSKRLSAQRLFIWTGDDSDLGNLRRSKILDADGRVVPFLTDEDELVRQGDLGVLSFESIYARRG